MTQAKYVTLDGRKYEIQGRSNGHEWIRFFGLISCAHCGTVRNATDTNRACQVKLGLDNG